MLAQGDQFIDLLFKNLEMGVGHGVILGQLCVSATIVAACRKVNVTKFIDINSLPNFPEQSVEVRGRSAAQVASREHSMSSYLPGALPAIDIDEMANHLLEQGLSTPPSELHGCLCGLLAAGGAPEAEAGLADLNQALDLDLHGALAGQVMELYTITVLSLQDDEFDFSPLLPDDSTDIVERTAALAAWCRGFLAGYAQVDAGAVQQEGTLPSDSSEILGDLAIIAQAEVDEDAEEEESENSYAELVEYIRVASLNAYMDCGLGRSESRAASLSAPPDGRLLH